MVDLVDLVAPFITTRGLHGAMADDTSVGFEDLELSRGDWESSKVIGDMVARFDVEVWGEMVMEAVASSLAGGGLCGVTTDGISTNGELFDA